MDAQEPSCHLNRLTDLGDAQPTLIEGLPGLGLVAAIAVDQITEQLELEHHGNIRSPHFPPVATFEEGRVVDSVRVYAGQDPDVMTLQSAMPVPHRAYEALSQCVLGQLAQEFRRAIFLVGTPAQSEEELGEIVGVATDETQLGELEKAGIKLSQGSGLIGGPTGALLEGCYHQDIPAIALIVRAHPQLPDPGAARALIEDAVEPLVDFDIDTTELQEQADEIKEKLQQVAQQYRQMQEQGETADRGEPQSSMYV